MICIICNKNDKEFIGQRKVCKDCKENLINNNSTKQCEYCGESKDKKLFSKTKQGIVCKICREFHNLDLKKEYHALHYKTYYNENKEKLIQKSRNWNLNNSEKYYTNKKNYRNKHKDEIDFRIKENLGCRLRTLIKKNNFKFIDFLACDLNYLKQWLEFNFKANMTWENYGVFWHIDHITPCAYYKNKSIEEQYSCWNWKNLAPLEAKENASKSNKINIIIIQYYKNRVIEYLKIYGEGSESIR